MTKISDLSRYGNNGKIIHGTAAILHRMFTKEDSYDREDELTEYQTLIHKLGYVPCNEE